MTSSQPHITLIRRVFGKTAPTEWSVWDWHGSEKEAKAALKRDHETRRAMDAHEFLIRPMTEEEVVDYAYDA